MRNLRWTPRLKYSDVRGCYYVTCRVARNKKAAGFFNRSRSSILDKKSRLFNCWLEAEAGLDLNHAPAEGAAVRA